MFFAPLVSFPVASPGPFAADAWLLLLVVVVVLFVVVVVVALVMVV